MKTIILSEDDAVPRVFGGMVKWTNGDISYYLGGKFHRDDGPAIIYSDNSFDKRYYLLGKGYSFEMWFRRLTEEQKIKALMNPENF